MDLDIWNQEFFWVCKLLNLDIQNQGLVKICEFYCNLGLVLLELGVDYNTFVSGCLVCVWVGLGKDATVCVMTASVAKFVAVPFFPNKQQFQMMNM